ncbi:MAG: GNAT family N-acetyltransferase [Lachnospiraceae bacterium]
MNIELYNELPKEAYEIRKEVFVEEQGFDHEFDNIDKTAKHLVAYDGEIPVATCRFFHLSNQKYVIGRIAVRKQYRGKHIGSYLLRSAEDTIKQLGGTEIRLHAQEKVKTFYEKQGYCSCGEIDFDESCPHVWMYKKLGKENKLHHA